jgi:hypothetical protein
MNADQDNSRYYIEDTLLLKFLITRFTEMLQIETPNLIQIWGGLGMAALHQNRELAPAFQTLISSDSYTVKEILTSSVDLFLVELARLEVTDATDYVPKKIERRPLTQKTTRKSLFWSWSEGRKMKKEKDFRFYGVWELLSWLALTSDEYLTAFEERCRFAESPTEEKIKAGLNVVKAAIFRRGIDDSFYQQDMPTRTTN